MTIFGNKLLLQIQSLIAKRDSDDPTSEIQYSFERPNIDIANPTQVLGIVSILLNGEQGLKEVEKLFNDPQFVEQVLEVQGSNSIKDDIEEALVGLIDKKTKLPKHTKKPKEVKSTGKGTLRSTSGQFFSIVTLQEVLNKNLHDQIKQNMGKGFATKILNYRTGRFADSAYVKKLVLDKDGTINAFYTYMHYPYQTFEPGFKQGEPTSRDPRKLISKSLREVAKDIVINKLKAIPE